MLLKEGGLTWIHDRVRPHFLHTIAVVFPRLVSVDGATAVVVRLMLGFYLAVVDPILQLEVL